MTKRQFVFIVLVIVGLLLSKGASAEVRAKAVIAGVDMADVREAIQAVEVLRQRIGVLTQQISGLDNQMKTLDERVGSYKKTIDDLNTDLLLVERRMDRLSAVVLLQDTIIFSCGAAFVSLVWFGMKRYRSWQKKKRENKRKNQARRMKASKKAPPGASPPAPQNSA